MASKLKITQLKSEVQQVRLILDKMKNDIEFIEASILVSE